MIRGKKHRLLRVWLTIYAQTDRVYAVAGRTGGNSTVDRDQMWAHRGFFAGKCSILVEPRACTIFEKCNESRLLV
jgi:hypothetical protein